MTVEDKRKNIKTELDKRFNHFTKIDENNYLIQEDKDSINHAFLITIIPKTHSLVMSGDWGSLSLRVFGNENLANWCFNATSISYFAEKVHNSDPNQIIKKFCNKESKKSIMECYFDDDVSEELFKMIENFIEEDKSSYDINDLIVKQMIKDGLMQEEDDKYTNDTYEKIQNILDNEFDESNEFVSFWTDNGVDDSWENIVEDYENRFYYKQKLILYWATKFKEGKFEDKDEENNGKN